MVDCPIVEPRHDDELVWGVDLGGTDCKVGVVDREGRVVAETGFATRADPDDTVAEIARACRDLAGRVDAPVRRLGLGAPGPMDLAAGVIVHAPNLGWRDVPLRDRVADTVGCPVTLDNDANAAAYGEAWVGAGRDARVLLLVTLGTGVGGGVVEEGRVFHGARGLAVEVGHQVVVRGGRPCSCTKSGCVEAYFSAHALSARAAEAGLASDDGRGHRNLFALYGAGDDRVVPWLDRAVDALAQGVAHAGVLFDPDRIVFTGGLTGSWETFADRLVEGIVRDMHPMGPSPERIGLSRLAGRAGVIGAAGLARSEA